METLKIIYFDKFNSSKSLQSNVLKNI